MTRDLCWGFTGVIFKTLSSGYYGWPAHPQGREPLLSDTHQSPWTSASVLFKEPPG